MKALTGENRLDLSVVNAMLLKQRAKLDAAEKKMDDAKTRIDTEKRNRKVNEVQVDELRTWATRFDEASYEAKHLVIAQLIDRIEVTKDYNATIHFRMTAEQFLGKQAESA